MKKITLLLFGLFTCWQINAQVSLYSFSETTETYAQITGTTSTATGDDGEQNAIPIGFNFIFGGTTHTTFSISTNGIIKLGGNIVDGTDNHWTNTLTNGTQVNKPLIAPFWDDNNMTGGAIVYSLTGTAPNQVLTINWQNSKIGGTGSTSGAAVSTLLRLYETTNVIEIVYSNPFTTANGVSASVGLNDATSFLSVTPATTSTVSSITANNGINATVMANLAGKKLIFTPPVPCSGAPVAGTVTPALQNICAGATPSNLVSSGYSSGVTGLTFQWEESNDDGVTDAWAPAVGGTGGTTAIYTPPVFSGTPIYYRLSITCTNSATSAQTGSVLVSTPSSPTNQVTAVTVPAGTVNYSRAVVNWTNGNGGRRVVYISDSATFTDPVDGNAPVLTANTIYSGSGQQIIFDGTGATVTVTGLATGTQYYIKAYEYVRCGAGPYDYYYNVTTGTNIATFTTCGIYAVPALEDFTTYVPQCWQEADNGDLTAGPATFGNSSWAVDGFGNVGTTGAMRVNLDSTGDNDWILSPLYTIPANYELKFDASANQWGTNPIAPTTPWEADDFVEVLVSTGTTNWTVLYTYNDTNVPSHTGTPNIIDLDAYAGQTVRFAFRGVEGPTSGGADIEFFVDNFQLRETPPCVEPTLLTATNVTDSSVDLSWTPGATELDWEYVVQPQGTGVPTGSGNAIDTNMFTETGLLANTAYEVYVRSFCDVTEQSTWVGPINFSTLCNPITSLPHAESFDSATNPSCWSTALISGVTNWAPDDVNDGVPAARTGARFAGKSWLGNDNALLISPVYNLAAYPTDQTRLNVWIYRSANGLSTDRVTFYANTENNLTGATMLVDIPLPITAAPTVSTAGWYNYIVNLPLAFNTGGDFYIIAQGRTSSSFSSYGIGFDDYVLELVPACPEPTGLSITSLTNSTVNITWAATTGDYEYVLDNDAALPAGSGISLSGETFTTASLLASTTYYFHVRSDCGSTWSTISFTTPLPPPANDDCTNAVVLTVNTDFACSTVTAGTTVGATNSGIEPTFTVTGTPDNDVWYSFTASASAHRISLLNIVAVTGFSTDMGIAVFDATGTCSALTLVGSSDPETYNLSGLTPGNIYYVAVYGWGASPGAVANFNICVGTPPAPPANDDCINAISISSMPYTNTQDASGASGPIVTTCSGMNDGVWYSVIGNGADIIIDVTNVNFDLAIGVYTGSCGSFTCVDVTDDSLTNETYTILASTLGTIYYINIGHYSGTTNNSEGTYTINVSTTLSSDSFDNSNFLAYPNPVKDMFNLSYSSEISSIRVVNLLGQEVISKTVNATSTQIDMSQLSVGTYIVSATVGDTIKTIKVVKQ